MNLKLVLCAFGFHNFYCNVTKYASYASFNNDFRCERCATIQTMRQLESSFAGRWITLKNKWAISFKEISDRA